MAMLKWWFSIVDVEQIEARGDLQINIRIVKKFAAAQCGAPIPYRGRLDRELPITISYMNINIIPASVFSYFLPDIDHELVVEAPVVEIMTQGADEHCQTLKTVKNNYQLQTI